MSNRNKDDYFSEEDYFNSLLLKRTIRPYRWGFDTYEIIQRDANPLPEDLSLDKSINGQDPEQEENTDTDTLSIKSIYRWFIRECMDNEELRSIRESFNDRILRTLEAPTEEPDEDVFAAIYG